MGLEELIRDVKSRAASDDPLERLTAAAEHQRDLTEQLDDVLDHFVREAREAGHSWTEIGDVLGVSRQAAQQRHRGRRRARRGRRGRVGRFTPSARAAVIGAQSAARELDHSPIGTEHVLLGLLSDSETLASQILSHWDIERAEIEAAVVDRSEDQGEQPGRRGGRRGHIPFSRAAKKSLEIALRECRALDDDHIGTEHILLALLRSEEGLAAQLLAERGVWYDAARDEIREAVAAGRAD